MLAEDLDFFLKTLGHHGRVLTRGSQIKSASREAHSVASLIDGGWRRQAWEQSPVRTHLLRTHPVLGKCGAVVRNTAMSHLQLRALGGMN